MLNILDFITNTLHLPVRRESATEYSSSCPICNAGVDRFVIFPAKNRWLCRGCKNSQGKTENGDLIDLIRRLWGYSYKQSLEYIGDERIMSASCEHRFSSVMKEHGQGGGEVWCQKAQEVIDDCNNNLINNESVLSWLKNERCLNLDTVMKHKLGWNTSKRFYSANEWGLDGKIICIPKGLTIPGTGMSDNLLRVKIRLSEPESSGDKYWCIRGSKVLPTIYGEKHRAIVVVESELDAILINQEVGDLITPIATCGASNMPDTEIENYIKESDLCLLAFDSDKDKANGFNPGREAALRWLSHYTNSKLWSIPEKYGKDPTEAMKNGMPLRLWVELGIKEYINKIVH